MISLETRVNGALIGYAYILNKGQADADNDKNCIYEVEYHRTGRKPAVMKFRVVHNREEEAEKLVLKVYQEIDKRLKKETSRRII